MHEVLEACRRLPLDGPQPPTWAAHRRAMRSGGKDGAAAAAAKADGGSPGSTMTGATMTATMTSAYVAKVSAALAGQQGAPGTDGGAQMLPLSCPGVVNAQVCVRGGGKGARTRNAFPSTYMYIDGLDHMPHSRPPRKHWIAGVEVLQHTL